MNKYDAIVCFICLVVGCTGLIVISLFSNNDDLIAIVSYDGNVVLEIDLNIDDVYEVDGYLGTVEIEVLNNKIRVVDETSPLNICSKQGFVDDVITPIICLPNKIIIELKSDSNGVDVII